MDGLWGLAGSMRETAHNNTELAQQTSVQDTAFRHIEQDSDEGISNGSNIVFKMGSF